MPGAGDQDIDTVSEESETPDRPTGLSRRNFLIGGSIAGGLVVAWAIWPRTYTPNLSSTDDERVFGAFLKISSSGKVTVVVPQCEMGQGVYTILPQVLADELGADWRTVAVEPAPISPLYANSVLAKRWAKTIIAGDSEALTENAASQWLADNVASRNLFIITTESTDIPAFADSYRQAGAAARILLTKAAAARWDVPWESCTVSQGIISADDKELRFGEVALEAAEQELPDPVPLKPDSEHTLVGQDVARLDLPSKLDGSANFAGDIRLPDMVYASLRQGPIGETRLKSFNDEGARESIGFIDAMHGGEWLAAIATNWWAANQALDAMSPVFETKGFLADTDKIDGFLTEALENGQGYRLASTGETRPAFEEHGSIRRIYQAEAALHAPVETPTATADYRDGQLEIWLATQAPAAAVEAAARGAGIGVSNVTLYPMLAGGSFDRNLDCRIAEQVSAIAKKMGRPVQLQWSRAEDMMHDQFRAPAMVRMDGAIDRDGTLQALQAKIAAPASGREQTRRIVESMPAVAAMRAANGEVDRAAIAGLEGPYMIANLTVDHHPAYVGVPTGNWRSNMHSVNAFARECFIDEIAAAAEREPLSYRMQMLGDQTRLARCLTGVAAMTGWDGGYDSSGQGIACHSMRGGHIAVIAQATRSTSGLSVNRISATVDIGRVIHPDIARQQIEGGIVFGLAMALGSATRFRRGLPTAERLRDLSLPRLAEIPTIQVEFIRSDEPSVGYEELGVPAVAPAIANALFSATGVRFRNLPLFSESI